MQNASYRLQKSMHLRGVVRTPLLGLFLAANLLLFSPPARAANFFQETWGIVTDPLKLRASSKTLAESVDRTLIQLNQMRSDANVDVKERLEQMRSILQDAISGGEAVIAKATQAMLEIEAKVNEDAIKLIYTTKCAVDVTLKTTAEESLTALLNQLADARPGIAFLGIKMIDIKTNKLDITNPNVAYQSARAATFDGLNSSLNESSSATRIFFAYQNLQAAAKYALCYYTLNNGPAGQKIWFEEINEMERLLTPWTVVVTPDISYRR